MLEQSTNYLPALRLSTENDYLSPKVEQSFFMKSLPSLCFYSLMARVVYLASLVAKAGKYSPMRWVQDSLDIANAIEAVGGVLHIEGMDNYKNIDGPCIFIGNHISTLETFVLPCLIQPYKEVVYVVKESLTTYPVFGHVSQARNPIVIGRTNPREDLSRVMEQGQEKLKAGTSIIIFPQSTRTAEFDPSKFNSIGVKLAKRAGVPVVPFALKTDFWSNGKMIKDFGYIHPERTVHFKFGTPLHVQGNGKEEHETIVEFIQSSLTNWL